ncbi:MAG: BON domain-containing protein [Methylococcaceae bacterium]|nr:BON domain-containing protein [Methylococcaceae bacterium]
MKKFLIFISIVFQLLLEGCSTVATGGAEITGLSLWHDRRTSKALAIDERIEINSVIELNSHDDTRNKCHFNVTSYNGAVLVSGEAPTEKLRNKIISIVRVIQGVKIVHNELQIASPSTFSKRSYDSYITTKIKTSISRINNIPGFDATRIKVVTESGTVFLLGLVHKNEADVVTDIARREKGVKKVVKIFEYIQ